MVFDESGALANVKRHDYLPFGEELFASQGLRTATLGYSANDGLRQQFTSKERDIETGLDYFLARYYSSTHGRFTSPDEFTGGPDELFVVAATSNSTFYADLTNPQSLNKYQYCFNSPLSRVDNDGHDPITIDSPMGRALQGGAIHAGATLMRDGQLRSQYTAAAKGATSAEREALRAATREKMSTFSRELSKVADNSRAGQSAKWTAESAKRTSPFWNKVGVVSEGAGRAATATAVAFSVVAIATAEPGHRGEAVATEVGAWTGAYVGGVGGAKVGAVIGTAIEPGVGTVAGAAVGGLVGGAGGAVAGSKVGKAVYNAELPKRPTSTMATNMERH
jgi:RHS repeat-associated protein